MAKITTAPATPDRWDDVQRALTGGGEGSWCQCAWPVLPASEWRDPSVAERKERLRSELDARPAPGLVAYVDGAAAGWVRVGPRPVQRRVLRSRIVTQGSQEPRDDPSVWAVTCFSVRKEHRRQGVVGALLAAAVEHASRNGARMVEAYPLDTSLARASTNELFVGTLSTFLRAGFHEVARPTSRRAVVALDVR